MIHSEYFSYSVREKAIVNAEDVSGRESFRTANALVVFVSVEENDPQNTLVVEKAISEILEVAEKLSPEAIVIYPYAHLSSQLAPPLLALDILKKLESKLREKVRREIIIHRAPFGWYKEFELKCKGHPLSELSRTIVATEEATPTAGKPKKEFLIMDTDGRIYKPEEYVFKNTETDMLLKALVDKEVFSRSPEVSKYKTLEYCKKFGFEWEPYSDYGHMRYSPHATVIIDSIIDYSWRVAKKLGIPILRVKGTNMFDLGLPPVLEHAKLYGDRLYTIKTDKGEMVLRYAACHQQFAMLKDYTLSYRDLPLGVFEVADSYRLEQSGEVTLCFRLRKFLMPDLHVLTKDLNEAMKIIFDIQKLIYDEIRRYGREYIAIYNVTKDFLEKYKDTYLKELVAREGKPVLLTVHPAGIYYWVLNVEYNIIDVAGRPREIATFQIDIGNSKRFGIKYMDEKGKEAYPIIIHTALIGSIERYAYMLFDTAALLEKKGEVPRLPVWVSPIQVRIIPVEQKHLEYAEKIYEELSSKGLRVDIDDRDESLGRRIRDAGVEWIPFIVVVGDKELETRTLNVRIRTTGEQYVMTLERLLSIILKEVEGYPRIESSLPKYVSQRPSLYYLRST